MTTAIYLRVSSPKGQKTDSQRAELEAWLKRHHYQSVQWFEDRESATTMQWDAFQRLQAAIFAGTITTVVVWKLDRLARSLKEGVNVLADWCQRGVRIIAITQQIDLSGPVGHLMASLLFGIVEIELQHAKERQAAGIAVAKQRGVYTGCQRGTTKAAPARARLAPAGTYGAGNRPGSRREGTHRVLLPASPCVSMRPITPAEAVHAKVHLTGAPGSGKTAILRQLELDGFSVVEEAATDVIALWQARGVAEPWTHPSCIDAIAALQRQRQVRASRETGEVQFHDRSAICTAALAVYLGYPLSDMLSRELQRIETETIYQKDVFFIQHLGFITPTAVRRISFEEALRFERVHEETYHNFGFALVPIAPGRLWERVEAIKRFARSG